MGFYFVISSAILLSLFLLAKRKEKYKTALIVCNTIVCVIYMGWRLTAIPWGGYSQPFARASIVRCGIIGADCVL